MLRCFIDRLRLSPNTEADFTAAVDSKLTGLLQQLSNDS